MRPSGCGICAPPFDFEPGELDQVESRLDVLYRLKKKYGGTVEEMLSYLERCRAELDEIAFSSDTLSRLEKEQAKRLALAREKAAALTEARKRAGGRAGGADSERAHPAGHAPGALPHRDPAQGGRAGSG